MADTKLTASVYVGMTGNVIQQAQKYNNGMRNMATNTQRQASIMARALSGIGKGIDASINKYTGAAGAGIVGYYGRQLGQSLDYAKRIQATNDMTVAQMKEMYSIAETLGLKYGRKTNDVLAVFEKGLIHFNGKFDQVRENIEEAVVVTISMNDDDVVELQANLLNVFKVAKEKIEDTMNVFKSQMGSSGQTAAIFNKGILALGNKSRNPDGQAAAIESGAFLMQAGKITGGRPTMAVNAIDETYDMKFDPVMRAKLEKNFIKFKDSKGVDFPIEEIIRQIREVTKAGANIPGGKGKKKIHTNDQIEAIKAIGVSEDVAKLVVNLDLKEFKEFKNKRSTPTNLNAEAAETQKTTMEASLNRLNDAALKFANMHLSEPIEHLSKAIGELDVAKFNEWASTMSAIAKNVGAIALAYKGSKLIGGLVPPQSALGTKSAAGIIASA